MIQAQPEPIVVMELLRMIKQAFPKQWREANYEIAPPNGKSFDDALILPEGVNGSGASP